MYVIPKYPWHVAKMNFVTMPSDAGGSLNLSAKHGYKEVLTRPTRDLFQRMLGFRAHQYKHADASFYGSSSA